MLAPGLDPRLLCMGTSKCDTVCRSRFVPQRLLETTDRKAHRERHALLEGFARGESVPNISLRVLAQPGLQTANSEAIMQHA